MKQKHKCSTRLIAALLCRQFVSWGRWMTLGATVALVPSAPILADDIIACYVDSLKYSNKGAYDAEMGVDAYVGPDHGNRWGFPGLHEKNYVNSGRTKTIDLEEYQNYCKHMNYVNCDSWMNLHAGQEVWLAIGIEMGDDVSCRKDTHKLYYKPGVGKTAHFKTGGTTLNNNRCKVVTNWEDICP